MMRDEMNDVEVKRSIQKLGKLWRSGLRTWRRNVRGVRGFHASVRFEFHLFLGW